MALFGAQLILWFAQAVDDSGEFGVRGEKPSVNGSIVDHDYGGQSSSAPAGIGTWPAD